MNNVEITTIDIDYVPNKVINYIEIKGRNGVRPGHCGVTGIQNSKRVTVAVSKSDICTISHISGTYLEENASDSLKAGLYGISFIMDCNKL